VTALVFLLFTLTYRTYQRDDSAWVSLILGTFGVEQNTFAGLTCPGSILCNTGLLGARVGGQGICGQRLIVEPEEVLREVELSGRCCQLTGLKTGVLALT
jgi:hypothetical protein